MTYISGARDDISPDEFTPQAISRKCKFARDLIGGGRPARDFSDCPHRDSDNFDDDLAWLLERLQEAGCNQVLTVDLSRPGFGVSVVRAVIPGLEAPHDDDNYVVGPRAARAGKAVS